MIVQTIPGYMIHYV